MKKSEGGAHRTILIVDDEVDLRETLATELELDGWNVLQAEGASAAKSLLQKSHVDLILTDIRMPGGSGIELLKDIKRMTPVSPMVYLFSGYADITAKEAIDYGAEALIDKPFELPDLMSTLRSGLDQLGGPET